MKFLNLFLFLILISHLGNAQKVNPEIKNGTALGTLVVLGGNEVDVTFTVEITDETLGFKWIVLGYGEGTLLMSKKGIENGNTMFTGQPVPGTTPLADNETFGIISRAAFKSLVEEKSFTYNGIKFLAKASPEPMKINGVEADVLHAASAEGGQGIWILNNALYPLIVQSSGLPIDIYVAEIK